MSQLYATFADLANAEQAVGALLDHGLHADDISLIANHSNEGNVDEMAKGGLTPTTAADAGAGAVGGAGIGFGVGALAALASLFVPGVGVVIGGGALASAIAATFGAMAGGAVAGGVTGYLVDQGMPSEAAVDYDRALANGGAVLSVQYSARDTDFTEVEELLMKYNARNIRLFEAALT